MIDTELREQRIAVLCCQYSGQWLRGRTGGLVLRVAGTSDSPVTTPQFYSSSYTEDTRRVTTHSVPVLSNSHSVPVLSNNQERMVHVPNDVGCTVAPGAESGRSQLKPLDFVLCSQVTNHLKEQFPSSRFLAAGWSLGAMQDLPLIMYLK